MSGTTDLNIEDLQGRVAKCVEAATQNKIGDLNALQKFLIDVTPLHEFRCEGFLHLLYNLFLKREEFHADFFSRVLPFMIKCLGGLKDAFPDGLPLLTQGQQMEVSLGKAQVASLLAGMFFSVLPISQQTPGGPQYPDPNFATLMRIGGAGTPPGATMTCILNYFDRLSKRDLLKGSVIFRRKVLTDKVDWDHCENLLVTQECKVMPEPNKIEDDLAALQVDFANQFLGGGVLQGGNVQEEIRFGINPELMVSMVFTAVLGAKEALLIKGSERMSNYSGYGGSYRYAGNHKDLSPRDDNGTFQTEIVAMDAIPFPGAAQFTTGLRTRELEKAYCAFRLETNSPSGTGQMPSPVATGNWGCGMFGGNLYLKSLLQIMAAAAAGRPFHYFTFNQYKFKDELEAYMRFLEEKRITVREMWDAMNNESLSPDDYFTSVKSVLIKNRGSSTG